MDLNDVVQDKGRLYLVFEFVDKDLKKYFDATDSPLSPKLIQVSISKDFWREKRFIKVTILSYCFDANSHTVTKF